MNTPSGSNTTALDKFILQYVAQGYDWFFHNNDIVFQKTNKKLYARAIMNMNNHIIGYEISKI